jgi:hypothetical protein
MFNRLSSREIIALFLLIVCALGGIVGGSIVFSDKLTSQQDVLVVEEVSGTTVDTIPYEDLSEDQQNTFR